MVSIFSSIGCPSFWINYPHNSRYSLAGLIFNASLSTSTSPAKIFKTYHLFPTVLVRMDSFNKPKKYTAISLKTMEPFILQENQGVSYGFRLGSQEFFVETEESLNDWVLHLSKRCVLTHIEEELVFIKIIGKGSSSKVYLAEHIDTRKKFAVKCIAKKILLKHENGLRNLAEEIRIMKEIKHDSIAELYFVYENTKSVYLVMEYLPFGDLYGRISQKKKFDEETTSKFMRNLVLTLEYLHSKHIVHRDLKLENIMMAQENDFEFKIIDFGLAYLSSSTQSTKCGSPGYVAPEMLYNFRYDNKIDIFSAGVIMYILLSGKHPFEARNITNILQKNIECKFSVNKKISEGATEILKFMMEPDPDLRPTASQILEHPWFNISKRPLYSWASGYSELGTVGNINLA